MNFKLRRQMHAEGLEPRLLMAADSAHGNNLFCPAIEYAEIGAFAPSQSSQTAEDIWPDTIPLPANFEPKGIELGKGHDFFVSGTSWSSLLGPAVFEQEFPLSPNAGAIYKGNLRTGEGAFDDDPDREFLVEPTGRPLLGLSYDARTDSIYAAVMDPGVAFSGEPFTNVGIVVYNGTTGEKVNEILIGDGPFLSNVLVTKSAVFATSNFSPGLYKMPLGPGGRLPASPVIEEIVMTGYQPANGFYAWGLEGSFDGRELLVLNGLNGNGVLHHVDTATGAATPITIDGAQQTFEDGDELYLRGRTLYISQVFSNSVAVVQLSGDLTRGTFVEEISTGELEGELNTAHSIVGFGDSIYAANVAFSELGTAGYQVDVVKLKK